MRTHCRSGEHEWTPENTYVHPTNGRRSCIPCRQARRIRYGERGEYSRTKRHLRLLRESAISAYGGTCACCGESWFDFLQIDHVDGGGTQHLKQIGGAARLCRWLRDNEYPAGFQVLCGNCNQAKGHGKGCPPHHDQSARDRGLVAA